jgi:hypothetical protein
MTTRLCYISCTTRDGRGTWIAQILNETIARVTDILGRELDAIAVERAVIGLDFPRARPDGVLDLLAEGDPALHFLGGSAEKVVMPAG